MKEQTAEEVLEKYPHNSEYHNYYHKRIIVTAMEEYATLKLQEQAKEIEYQQQVMNTQAEKIVDMNAEIERLKVENEKL
jgi:hypothetical protein